MEALCYKDNKVIKTLYHVTRVETDDKYGYFVFHQKLYKHTIIFVKRYNEYDKVVTIDKGKFGSEVRKEYKPHETN